MENLGRNNGRLSPEFEACIAAQAQVVVDRFAGRFLTMKWRDSNTIAKIPTVISTKITSLSRGRTAATSPAATSPAANAVPSSAKSPKLKAVMKGLHFKA
jgi:hypothetical protein